MYVTISEVAAYLTVDEAKIRKLVLEGRIRAIHDGEQFMINKEQFNTHLEQMEKYRKMMQEYLKQPMPGDIDVRDED